MPLELKSWLYYPALWVPTRYLGLCYWISKPQPRPKSELVRPDQLWWEEGIQGKALDGKKLWV